MKLRVLMFLENWYCHKLTWPGNRYLCDRFDEWVMRDGPEA